MCSSSSSSCGDSSTSVDAAIKCRDGACVEGEEDARDNKDDAAATNESGLVEAATFGLDDSVGFSVLVSGRGRDGADDCLNVPNARSACVA